MAKLLIVDDDEGTLSWMTAAFESLGHKVRGALGARAALEAVNTERPDLIIADILMPELDGLTFARIVRRHQNVPVMFLSIARRQAEAVLLGAVGFVQKPATATEIREAVTRVLGDRRERSTILIVDDDADIREAYRACLEPSFNVLEAEHGRVALDRLREQRVDLAIVDVRMPVMNGAELVRAMRADPRLDRLPVIVQTNDQTALRASVWRDLRVERLLTKMEFANWLSAQISDHLSEKP
jgi:CheY-like chemotaxis protein